MRKLDLLRFDDQHGHHRPDQTGKDGVPYPGSFRADSSKPRQSVNDEHEENYGQCLNENLSDGEVRGAIKNE